MPIIVQQAYQHLPNKQLSQNPEVGGWSFLQALSQTKDIVRDKKEDTVYVHPIEKRPVTKPSLEMCTESLGTENGSDSGDEISLLALEATNIPMIPFNTKPQKEMTRGNTFPPPLNFGRTVKTYKEDGRLVIQAIRVCSPPRCFVSQRCEGRLRLCLSEDSSFSHDGEDEELEENGSEYEEGDTEEEEEGIMGNNENFEVDIGNERPSMRCNEKGCESKTMLKWKQRQFWVTT